MTTKNWRNAVIVVRFTATLPLRNVQWGLSRLLKVHHNFSPSAANRAVIWSINEEDKKRLEEMGLFIILEVGKVRFEKWNPETIC